MKKIMTKVMCGVLLFVMIFGMGITGGCAKNMTVEQHMKLVSDKINKKYINEETGFTDFKLRPLYNEKDELKYMVVDFEPCGYMYIIIREHDLISELGCFGSVGPYTVDFFCKSKDDIEDCLWQRYTFSEEITPLNENWRHKEKEELWWGGKSDTLRWEIDNDGQFIYYNKSEYEVAGIDEDRCYLLTVYQNDEKLQIPAVKKGDKYINLISMEEFEYKEKYDKIEQAARFLGFMCKIYFNL